MEENSINDQDAKSQFQKKSLISTLKKACDILLNQKARQIDVHYVTKIVSQQAKMDGSSIC